MIKERHQLGVAPVDPFLAVIAMRRPVWRRIFASPQTCPSYRHGGNSNSSVTQGPHEPSKEEDRWL